MLIRRLIVAIVCCTFLAGQHRDAFAYVAPVPAPVIITAGGPIAWTVAAIAAAAAAGVAIWKITFKKPDGSDAVDVVVNSKATATVPPGWTPGANPYLVPVPPNTTGAVTVYGAGGSCVNLGSQAAAGDCACARENAGGPYGFPGGVLCASYVWGSTAPAACGGSVPCLVITRSDGNTFHLTSVRLSTGTACPAGYSSSGGVCTLTSALDVPYPTDGKGQVRVGGGTINDDTRDPDNATPPNVTKTPTQITIKEGNTTTTVKVNGDGSVSITSTVGNGNGTSTRTTANFTTADDGAADGGTKVKNVKTETVTGEGTGTDTDPNVAAVVTCTNCATENTQQGVKATLDAMKTDGVKVQEQAATWSAEKTNAETARTEAMMQLEEHKKKFTDAQSGDASKMGIPGFLAWTVPAAENAWGSLFPTPAACQPLATAYRGGFTMNFCPVSDYARPFLEWFLYVATVMYIYTLFWRRGQG